MRGPKPMTKKRFTEEPIAFTLRQAEAGTPIADIGRKLGVSEATFYRWKKPYGGMGVAEVRRRQLEEENQKLKQLVADLSPDKKMLQDVLSKKSDPVQAAGHRRGAEGRVSGERAAGLPGPGVPPRQPPLPEPDP